ncbi:MAG: hypothetical protein FJ033_09955 [Chloroflexi bacterium]|nr:hypothetical protein [Chloroflexota bacterium]
MKPPEGPFTAAIADRTLEVIRQFGRFRGGPDAAAASLCMAITTTPFEERETVFAALLTLCGVSTEQWTTPLSVPGGGVIASTPRDAMLMLIDRERTYLSNVPAHSAFARVVRALVRRGDLARLVVTPRDRLYSALVTAT